MTQKRMELERLHERMNGLIFDVEYGVDAVRALGNSDEHFNVSSMGHEWHRWMFPFQNIATYLEKSVYISKQMNLLRQQQVQQHLVERKPGSAS